MCVLDALTARYCFKFSQRIIDLTSTIQKNCESRSEKCRPRISLAKYRVQNSAATALHMDFLGKCEKEKNDNPVLLSRNNKFSLVSVRIWQLGKLHINMKYLINSLFSLSQHTTLHSIYIPLILIRQLGIIFQYLIDRGHNYFCCPMSTSLKKNVWIKDKVTLRRGFLWEKSSKVLQRNNGWCSHFQRFVYVIILHWENIIFIDDYPPPPLFPQKYTCKL